MGLKFNGIIKYDYNLYEYVTIENYHLFNELSISPHSLYLHHISDIHFLAWVDYTSHYICLGLMLFESPLIFKFSK